MQLTLLITSPRVAPGLMSWPAWQAVASADRVLASDDTSPLFRAVTAAGHRVDVLTEPSVDALLAQASERDVVWLADDLEATDLPTQLAAALVSAGEIGGDLPAVEVVHGSYDVPGARLLDLVTVMDRLRESCPWDREQTHRSLARYLLEESYETLEAIETGDHDHLREELGDLLLQVYFHARIASEDPAEGFSIDDVAGGIVDKLVSRHPHVFGDVDAATAEQVEANWEALKAAEKQRNSVLDGVPLAMPALALADKVLGRAAKAGVAPDRLGELDRPVEPHRVGEPVDGLGAEEIGHRLLQLVVEARAAGVDPEQALRDAVRRLADAVRTAETPT